MNNEHRKNQDILTNLISGIWHVQDNSKLVKSINFWHDKLFINVNTINENASFIISFHQNYIHDKSSSEIGYSVSHLNEIVFVLDIAPIEKAKIELIIVEFNDKIKIREKILPISNNHNLIRYHKKVKTNNIKVALSVNPQALKEKYIIVNKIEQIKLIDTKCFYLHPNESDNFLFKPRKDIEPYKLTIPMEWNINPFSDRNWCYQLQAWRMIDNPLEDFEKTYDLSKLNFCFKMMEEWCKFAIEEKKTAKLMWDEMAAGIRALKISFIIDRISIIDKSKIDIQYLNMLVKLANFHIEKIKSQEVINNNHGLFQMHGLLLLSFLLKNYEVQEYALEQINILINNQFNKDGFHSENSDEYHWFIRRILNKMTSFGLYKNNPSMNSIIDKSIECNIWTVFPDNSNLMIGDSTFCYRKIKLPDEIGNDNVVKTFPDSGYLFIRSGFQVPVEQSFMFFLKSSFTNKTHRHSDDFNILLFEYGTNILVDAGKYSYDSCDERRYAVSTRAHNTVMIDNTDYNRLDLFYKSALEYCRDKNGTYEIKTSIHREEMSIKHERLIIYRPNKFLIVVDNLSSNKVRRYNQIWHFNEKLAIAESEDNFVTEITKGVYMNIKSTSMKLDNKNRSIFSDKTSQVILCKGQKKPELQGWRSLTYRNLIENYALQNIVKTKKTLLITEFTFSDKPLSKNTFDFTINSEQPNKKLSISSSELELDTKFDISDF